MTKDVCMIFFQSGRGTLETAESLLRDRGCMIDRQPTEYGGELHVTCGDSPVLRIGFVADDYVLGEAGELSEGTPHAQAMSQCDVRYEIAIDDLDAVLDEINTLIEVQATLQDATGGYIHNSWNGKIMAPEA